MSDEISLYIHIPFCLSKCEYCDFFSVPEKNCVQPVISDEYIDALCNEIRFRIQNYKSKKCKSVYIGGGTPSLLSEMQIKKLCDSIFGLVSKTEDFEFSFEVNPDDVNKELLSVLEKNGINRISCGIQSLNDEALKNVKRRAGVAENIAALNCFSKYWKKQLSLDLICGLPLENEESFISGLKKIIEYKPDHISMYSLTIEDETPLGKKLSNGDFEYDFNESDDLWLKGKELLESKGYFQYEVSNFCKKNHECMHNMTYWKHDDYLGTGCGGTGTIYNSDGTGVRWTNTKNIRKYIDFWLNPDLKKSDKSFEKKNIMIPEDSEIVSLDDSVFEYFMMGLRKLSGISDSDFFQHFGFEIPEKYVYQFKKWKSKGLCEIDSSEREKKYRLNKKGILFLNRFLEEL